MVSRRLLVVVAGDTRRARHDHRVPVLQLPPRRPAPARHGDPVPLPPARYGRVDVPVAYRRARVGAPAELARAPYPRAAAWLDGVPVDLGPADDGRDPVRRSAAG